MSEPPWPCATQLLSAPAGQWGHGSVVSGSLELGSHFPAAKKTDLSSPSMAKNEIAVPRGPAGDRLPAPLAAGRAGGGDGGKENKTGKEMQSVQTNR